MLGSARARLATLATLAAFVVACGGRQTPAPDDAFDAPIDVFEATLDRYEALSSVRLRATLEYWGEEGRVRVDQVVLARRPGDVRVETISPFGTTLTVFATNADELVYYDLQANEFVRGRPELDHISRFLPFHLTAQDIVRVLLGAPPLDAVDPDPDTYAMEWDARRAAYRLTMPLSDDAGTLRVWIDHGSWTMVAARMTDAEGDRIFDLRSGNAEPVQGATIRTQMPTRIEFEMPGEDVDIALDVERVELDPTLPDALFTVPTPRAATTFELD